MSQVFIPWEKSVTIIGIWNALGKLKLYVDDSPDLPDNSLVNISSQNLGWPVKGEIPVVLDFSNITWKQGPSSKDG